MPLMPQDITGISNQQTASLNQQGQLAPVMRTTFKVKGQGPFFVELPLAGWTADAADKAIWTYAQELCKLLDKYPGA